MQKEGILLTMLTSVCMTWQGHGVSPLGEHISWTLQ